MDLETKFTWKIHLYNNIYREYGRREKLDKLGIPFQGS